MDELGLAEALQAEHLVVGLERGVADLRVGGRLEGAHDGARLVDRLVLVQLVQVHLQGHGGWIRGGEPRVGRRPKNLATAVCCRSNTGDQHNAALTHDTLIRKHIERLYVSHMQHAVALRQWFSPAGTLWAWQGQGGQSPCLLAWSRPAMPAALCLGARERRLFPTHPRQTCHTLVHTMAACMA